MARAFSSWTPSCLQRPAEEGSPRAPRHPPPHRQAGTLGGRAEGPHRPPPPWAWGAAGSSLGWGPRARLLPSLAAGQAARLPRGPLSRRPPGLRGARPWGAAGRSRSGCLLGAGDWSPGAQGRPGPKRGPPGSPGAWGSAPGARWHRGCSGHPGGRSLPPWPPSLTSLLGTLPAPSPPSLGRSRGVRASGPRLPAGAETCALGPGQRPPCRVPTAWRCQQGARASPAGPPG